MGRAPELTIQYRDHPHVKRLIDVLRYLLEDISLAYDRSGDPAGRAPGMYVAVLVGPSVESYADPMGDNRWPASAPRDPFTDEGFAEAATKVAHSCDGAVVVAVDGVANRQLVRFRSGDVSRSRYEPWMGARHMSALDISMRFDVIATLTLSEESGRVTVFDDGDFESVEWDDLGGPWRAIGP